MSNQTELTVIAVSMEARVRAALIDIDLTAWTCKALHTLAVESKGKNVQIHFFYAHSSILTGIAGLTRLKLTVQT